VYFRFTNDLNYDAQYTTLIANLTLKIYPGGEGEGGVLLLFWKVYIK
jgi:hypothetical protein